MLDRLGDELFGDSVAPADVLHTELAHAIQSENGTATLRINLPFGERGDVGLKKVGPELIVSVGPRKRTIILPTALARRTPDRGEARGRRARGELRDLDRRRPPVPEEPEHQCVELCPICRGAEVLRATSSPELRGQWQSVQREALVTMRTMIDHYLERLDEYEREGRPTVEEIPID